MTPPGEPDNRLTPEQALINLAYSYLDLKEEGGDNRGQVIERMTRFCGLNPPQPWCAAAVAWWGWHALRVDSKTSRWPLPKTASCWQLGESARKAGLLREAGKAGDVFLIYYPSLNRFAHTGVLVRQEGDRWVTIEGNTNNDGSRNGWGVCERRRTFGPKDRFVRWTEAI